MFKLKYDEIITRIVEEKGLKKEKIEARINEKIKILGDLISREGAAHIVANELGVKVFEDLGKREVKIKHLMPGVSNITIPVKIISIYEVRHFKNDKREGNVLNLLVGDDTGVTRLVVWDEKLIGVIQKLKEGDIL